MNYKGDFYKLMFTAVGDALAGAVGETSGNIVTTSSDPLVQDIVASQSAHIVGYFLDSEQYEVVDYEYRAAALKSAMRLIKDPAIKGGSKDYLRGLIKTVSETKDDDLQQDAKELLMSVADDSELSDIALDEDEDTDVRISAVNKMKDKNFLLDIAADAEDENVRQAAKIRIKGFP